MTSALDHAPRGAEIRAALLAVVRRCAAEQRPLPTHAALSAAMGCSQWQITRQMNVLMDRAAFTPVQVGRRMYVGGMGA
jgi:hypothetical protein